MIQLPMVTSVLLFFVISLPTGSADASPNRVPLYQCQNNIASQRPTGRKPHVFVYIEDRAFNNIAQQARNQAQKYSNYEITKGELPIGRDGGPQSVLYVSNRGRYISNGRTSSHIQTQIPSPIQSNYERASDDREQRSDKTNKDSIVVQIPINKYFDCKNTEIVIKIGKRGEAETKTSNMAESRESTDNCAPKVSELNMNKLQQLYRTPVPIPASYRNTEIGTQTPRTVELPISFDALSPAQLESPKTDATHSIPSYMILPSDDLAADYTNNPTIPTAECEIKNIVFPEEGGLQQNTPQSTIPLGRMVDLDKQVQAELNCEHGGSISTSSSANLPIKDIDVGEFESFVQQQAEENQEKHEKCSSRSDTDGTKNNNASIEITKKNTTRNNKTKCTRKNVKEYGLILSPDEP